MSEVASPASRALSRWGVVLALYAFATLILTYPLSLNMRSLLPLGAGDIWQNLWNFWWWKRALFELHVSPYWTNYLFHPSGVSLALHTHSPLNVIATLPISLLFGIEAAYNSALLATFALAGLGAYLLVRELTREPRAAFVAGAFFAFTPMHFEQSLEHLNLSSIQFLPLFLYSLLRLLRQGGRGSALGTGLVFAGNALVSWQYGLLAIPIGMALALRELRPSRRRRDLRAIARDLLLAGALAVLLTLPFAWPMIREALSEAGVPHRNFRNIGTDPIFWFLPSDQHPVLGVLTRDLYSTKRAYSNAGFLSYIGLVPFGLAALALCSRRFGGGHRIFWGTWVGIFLLLSLGMHPVIFGELYREVTLPHGWFQHLPLLKMLSSANRFMFFAQIGLCVLMGASLSVLFREGRSRLAWVLGVLLMFEFLWLPYPTRVGGTHPYLAELARNPRAGAVLHLPFPISARHSEAMYDQTSHQRPIIGGYASYLPAGTLAPIESSVFLSNALHERPVRKFDPGELSALGIGTVVVHLDRTHAILRRRALHSGTDYYARRAYTRGRGYRTARLQALLVQMQRSFAPPLYADDRLVVFRVPDAQGR